MQEATFNGDFSRDTIDELFAAGLFVKKRDSSITIMGSFQQVRMGRMLIEGDGDSLPEVELDERDAPEEATSETE